MAIHPKDRSSHINNHLLVGCLNVSGTFARILSFNGLLLWIVSILLGLLLIERDPSSAPKLTSITSVNNSVSTGWAKFVMSHESTLSSIAVLSEARLLLFTSFLGVSNSSFFVYSLLQHVLLKYSCTISLQKLKSPALQSCVHRYISLFAQNVGEQVYLATRTTFKLLPTACDRL